MDTTARSLRNDQIVALRSRGKPVAEIARQVGLTERHCRRVLNERRAARSKREVRTSEKSTRTSGGTLAQASSTELLDTVQKQLGKLASMATQLTSRYDGLGPVRIEITARIGEDAIAELRRRGAEFDATAPPPGTGADNGSD